MKSEPMVFWAFEDVSAVFHAVLFPKAYAKFCRLLVSAQLLMPQLAQLIRDVLLILC